MSVRTRPSDRERFLRECSPEMEAAFPIEEYRRRLARTREAMASAELDVVYLSSPESMCWLSGFAAEWYQGQSPTTFYPASGLAVHADHDRWIHFDTEDEWILAKFTSVSEDLRIHRHGTDEGVMEFIVRELRQQGWLEGCRVGLEMWASRPNRGYSERFQAALEAAGATVVDATKLIRGLRRRKSPAELAHVRTAQRIADIGMQAAIDTMCPGMTELEVYAEIVHAMARAGGENPGITMPVASGAKSACVHALASRRVIMPGDIVNVDVSGVYNRYHANMARCFSIGEPSTAVAQRCEAVYGAVDVVRRTIRPGLPVRELLSTVEEYYRAVDLLDEWWWIGGYELGIAFPPDWVGEFYFDLETDAGDAAFEPGDVTNYEANFYLPEGAGLAMCINTMVFEQEEARFLHTTPDELIVIG
jgi:Xaa-Pro aminopeptidase